MSNFHVSNLLDNLNAFIGVCFDYNPTELLIAWRHCFYYYLVSEQLVRKFHLGHRGTLADVLFSKKNGSSTTNDDGSGRNSAMLDENLKAAFVRDINRVGLKFISDSCRSIQTYRALNSFIHRASNITEPSQSEFKLQQLI